MQEVCTNEKRIITLEQQMEYKDQKMDEMLNDNKEIKSDLQKLTIAVTELSNTLRIREEDSRKLDKLENDLIELKTQIRTDIKTLKFILPIIFTIITVIISAISLLIQLRVIG